jgi:hypothetical protein
MDCARVRNRASAGEAVSAKISKAAETQFSVTIAESKGMCVETNPDITWGSSSVGDFRVARDSLSVMISESTRTVCVDQSVHQMWRLSR